MSIVYDRYNKTKIRSNLLYSFHSLPLLIIVNPTLQAFQELQNQNLYNKTLCQEMKRNVRIELHEK